MDLDDVGGLDDGAVDDGVADLAGAVVWMMFVVAVALAVAWI